MNSLEKIVVVDVIKFIKKIVFSELNKKTIIITGASGLIGTYILATLRELREKGIVAKVVAVTQSGFPKDLAYLSKGVKFIKGDLTDPDVLASLPEADYIIHAAGYGQPGKFMEDQLKTISLNTTCTIELLKKLRSGGKFLFISTSEVYSGLIDPPHRENQIGSTGPDHPRACYIEGKRCGEAIINAARQKGIDAKSARLSLAYGPGVRKGDKRALNSFISRALDERKIELIDSGEAKRTYCYVSDAVRMMWQILLEGKDSMYNVGGVSKTTIADLARMIGNILKVPVIIPDAKNILAGAPVDVSLNLDKIKTEFGEIDFVSLDEGIKKAITWQKFL